MEVASPSIPEGWEQWQSDIAIKMFNENYPMSTIGEKIGKSRSAVSGYIARLRRKENSPITRIKEVKIIRTPLATPRPAPKGRAGEHLRARTKMDNESKPKRIRIMLVESPHAVTMAELGKEHCKWPLGDPKRSDFRFCGHQRLAGLPYCADHTVMAAPAIKAPSRDQRPYPR